MTIPARNTMQDFDIPSFRIKKAHKKSRLGCIRCKARRVKCDETKPDCKQCRRRGLSCTYEVRTASNGSSPNSNGSPVDPILAPADLGVTDTELMRHFFSHTCDTFVATSVRGEHADLWRIVVPALAYTHTPIRLGIITASALCISHDSALDPQAAKKYFEVAKSHGEHFVAEARAQARRFDSSEYDSILVCSRLLSLLGFAFHQVHRSNGVKLCDAAAWTWLHLLRGVVTVYKAVLRANAELDPILSINMIPEVSGLPGTPALGMQWHREHRYFPLVRDSQQERVESLFATLNRKAAEFTTEQAADIRTAIISLDEITSHVCNNENHSVFRAVCTWPGNMTNGFVNMLLENEPFALAIYAHWLMLISLLDSMWWFDDMSAAEVDEIAEICSRDDPDVTRLLEWPRSMLESKNVWQATDE